MKEKSMSIAVVWLDHEHAKLFRFSADRMERKIFLLVDDVGGENGMFDRISEALVGDDGRVLILGPGLPKTRYLQSLWGGHPDIARKIVGCEASELPSDDQIAEYALKYFKKRLA